MVLQRDNGQVIDSLNLALKKSKWAKAEGIIINYSIGALAAHAVH